MRMKNLLVPVILGSLGLSLVGVNRVAAQNGFNSSSLPNANPLTRTYSPPSALAPPASSAQPQAQAPAAGYPGAPAYGGYSAGYPGMPGPYSTAPIDPNHKLGQGDRLSYSIVEDRDGRVVPLTVTASGEVDVPLIGRVRAAGKSPQQLASEIKSRLDKDYYYNATINMGLDTVAPPVSRGRVYISGYVRTEGPVDLPPDEAMTVSQAISKAGGFREYGDQKNVRVIRKDGPPKGILVNVAAVNKGDDKDVVLQPGDKIVVKANPWNF
jgi:protein involved in polysaccharide export with SLBB domain